MNNFLDARNKLSNTQTTENAIQATSHEQLEAERRHVETISLFETTNALISSCNEEIAQISTTTFIEAS